MQEYQQHRNWLLQNCIKKTQMRKKQNQAFLNMIAEFRLWIYKNTE